MEVYKCRECPKTFNIKAMLDYHMKIHANANKPYKCTECGKGFAQRGGLVTHSLVHTGAKPYVCQVCGKAFRQKYHLTQHNLIHSGVKPFSCEICHKCFNVKMNLREHMRRHTGDRPYKCPFCTIIGFFRKKMLKEHIIKSHPEEEMPEELLGTDISYITGGGESSNLDFEGDGEMELDAADQAAFDQQILEEAGNAVIIPDGLVSEAE
jgi:DNA-directed RNA polymerase subunit RPC12/RpoP